MRENGHQRPALAHRIGESRKQHVLAIPIDHAISPCVSQRAAVWWQTHDFRLEQRGFPGARSTIIFDFTAAFGLYCFAVAIIKSAEWDSGSKLPPSASSAYEQSCAAAGYLYAISANRDPSTILHARVECISQ